MKKEEKELKDASERQLLLAEERTSLAYDRNRFANQRTYLSWTRTGLAGVGGGVAMIRLLTFEDPSHRLISEIIGSVLILWGIAIFILSFLDYKKSYLKFKKKDGYAGSLMGVALFSMTLVALSLLLFVITFREKHPS